jgi:hypothetical protein
LTQAFHAIVAAHHGILCKSLCVLALSKQRVALLPPALSSLKPLLIQHRATLNTLQQQKQQHALVMQAAGWVGRVIDTLQLYLCSFPERCCAHQDGYSSSLLCSSLSRHVLTMCSFGVAHTI